MGVNEKVALEVGLGAAYAGGRALVAMKHVGVNVAADPLFTASYTGVNAGLVVVTADDPSMHSSQNEQDNRHYAIAARVPMLEPSDSECLEFTKLRSAPERFDTPVVQDGDAHRARAEPVELFRARIELKPWKEPEST